MTSYQHKAEIRRQQQKQRRILACLFIGGCIGLVLIWAAPLNLIVK